MQSQNESINALPWVTVECSKLPSRGLPYPKGAKVKYRTYTHGEVRNASISSFETSNALEMALAGIEAEGFQKNKLTLQDVFYLGLLRKASTMNGMQMEIPFHCKACGAASKKVFSERDIEFQDIDESVEELPIEADIGGKSLLFTPISVQQFIDFERGVYNQFTKDGKPDAVGVEAIMITNLKFSDAYKHLYELTNQDDLDVLDEVDKLLMHDIKNLEAICTNALEDKTICNQKNYIRLEGREGLLRPFREGEGSVRARVRTSKKQHSEPVPDPVPGVHAGDGASQKVE